METFIKGHRVIVDDCDGVLLRQCNWGISPEGYVQAWHPHVRGTVTLHRLILNAQRNQKVDHKNGNPFDNRRSNLRIATTAQNAMNMRKKSTSISKYKGVMWEKARAKWVARIKAEGKYLNLGRFDTQEAAARAYNIAAKKHYGEFALLNDVRQ